MYFWKLREKGGGIKQPNLSQRHEEKTPCKSRVRFLFLSQTLAKDLSLENSWVSLFFWHRDSTCKCLLFAFIKHVDWKDSVMGCTHNQPQNWGGWGRQRQRAKGQSGPHSELQAELRRTVSNLRHTVRLCLKSDNSCIVTIINMIEHWAWRIRSPGGLLMDIDNETQH